MSKTIAALAFAMAVMQIGAASAEGLKSNIEMVPESIPVTQPQAINAKRCEWLLNTYGGNLIGALSRSTDPTKTPAAVTQSAVIADEARNFAMAFHCDMVPFFSIFASQAEDRKNKAKN